MSETKTVTKKIPLLDLKRQYASIKGEIDSAIQDIVAAQYFIMGKEITKLEESIAAYCGTKYAVGVSSGTDALILALRASAIGQGDEVLTVPFTFIATAEAISTVGAIPVFVDIDKRSYTMDPAKIEEKITSKTKAIIPVHLYGQCAEVDKIMNIARKHNLLVIEDCAQALGALHKNKKAGSFGIAGCISFFPSKNLGGFGDGGMIVTSDEKLADTIKLLRVHGSGKRYLHSILGYNSRLDNLQAAVLNVKLKYFDKWVSKRIENAGLLNEAFKEIKGLQTPKVLPDNNHTYHQYALCVDSSVRDSLMEFLVSNGIESRVYYPIPLHVQECYQSLGYKAEDLPASSWAASSTLVLPVFPEMEGEEIAYVVDKVKEFCKDKAMKSLDEKDNL